MSLRPGDPCPYDLCDGSGFMDDEATRTARPCRCRPERIASRQTSALNSVVPKRYRGLSWSRPPLTEIAEVAVPQTRLVKAFVRDIDANLDAGRGLWLFGAVGTGKTTLTMLVAAAALEAGRSVAIYSLPRLLAEIRSTFDDDATQSYTALLEKLTEVDLLHIDDVGAEQTSSWVLEQLYAIVNARYEEERSITLTTNLVDRADLVDQINERTVSRLEQMCEPIRLEGSDARRALA